MLSNPKLFCATLSGMLPLCPANGWLARSQTAQQSPQQENSQPATRGKQTFVSSCAGCHGLDGRGGERAPNIAEKPKTQQLSDARLFHIIENGIPGTGMPAFHSLERADIKAVVTYLRTLQGTKTATKLPADPNRPRTTFF